MFTGIIQELGRIQRIESGPKAKVLIIEAEKVLQDVKLGDSIAVNGICLTVTDFDSQTFSVDVMHETLERTALHQVKPNSRVNLEPAMAMTDRFGGHMVSGHVDGTGRIRQIRPDGIATWYEIETSPQIMRYIIEKGSVCIDGISLTVAKVHPQSFEVSIIPHTSQHTNLSSLKVNDLVNLENDLIAKYIEKFLAKSDQKDSKLTQEFLEENGF